LFEEKSEELFLICLRNFQQTGVQYSEKERAITMKYHKVRFFERQKLTRKLKQIEKKLNQVRMLS
jgi:hypothetical protein